MAKKILIVDDNPNMASLLTEMLEIFDYDSICSSSGEEALEKLGHDKFAMVITDMKMPNMSGLDLLEQVKTKYPKMPVILISGYTMVGLGELDESSKPDGFLAKPFMMSDIENLLNQLL